VQGEAGSIVSRPLLRFLSYNSVTATDRTTATTGVMAMSPIKPDVAIALENVAMQPNTSRKFWFHAVDWPVGP